MARRHPPAGLFVTTGVTMGTMGTVLFGWMTMGTVLFGWMTMGTVLFVIKVCPRINLILTRKEVHQSLNAIEF